jgi:uncharacterized protein YmfQ (DUF2313 family)
MSRSVDTVVTNLLSYSVGGDALPVKVQPGALWPLWLRPLAAEISRFESYAEEMEIEVNPGESVYLLADWVRMFGADPYGRDTVTLTTAQQQQLALQRLTSRGGASIGYFEDCAAAMGLAIVIEEQTIWECGKAVCGDPISCSPQEFFWLVIMPASSEGTFAGNSVQTEITQCAPSQTQPVFSYTG